MRLDRADFNLEEEDGNEGSATFRQVCKSRSAGDASPWVQTALAHPRIPAQLDQESMS